jgi:hypothetical protein
MEATENGRYVIKASTILDITLEDYHQSRQQFGNEFGRENANENSPENNNNNNYINLNANNIMAVCFILN